MQREADQQQLSAANMPSLGWLIAPVSTRHFFEDYWEKKPLLVRRNQPDYFHGLLSLEDIDRVLATADRRYPDIALKDARRDLRAAEYTVRGNRLDVARVYQLFSEGSTLTLAFLQDVIPTLRLLCRSLEAEFTHPIQTNVYLTPPRAQGAQAHYDTHDVLVLQTTGTKDWTIYSTPVELPLPGQEFNASSHELGAATLNFRLEPGDMAYIPRGVAHDAHSTDELSLHITTGILQYTWTDLLLEVLACASLQDPEFRKALPRGFARPEFDRTRALETLQRLLNKACSGSNLDAGLGRFIDEFISGSPPLLTGQMKQLAMLDRLGIESIAGARPAVHYLLQVSDDSVTVECYGRTITFPSYAAEGVRFALSHPRFAIRDLSANLDDSGKLTLVRRLIREGLVIALPGE